MSFVQLPYQGRTTRVHAARRVVHDYLPRLDHGFEIFSAHAIRVTPDAEFGLRPRRDENLLMSIEQGNQRTSHGRRGAFAV